ncbi:MAG: ABC transporter substrate-binding protein [Clostridiales bacterium]|nr:ABC transporter substrate-binding protein [Clostridiales bacterium]
MKKRLLALLMALAMMLALAACGSAETETITTEETADAATEDAAEEEAESEDETEAEAEAEAESEAEAAEPEETEDTDEAETVVTRIGSLKGPTSIGLTEMMSWDSADYSFTMETDASALLTEMVSGELDIALIPANAAAIWNTKIEGGVTCIDVNTLGVLYVISADDSIASIEDLAGRTIYLPGQGTSPDYVLQYLLAQHDMSLDDVNVEYQSEAAEVIAALTADPEGVGLLPQPSVTAALNKLEGFSIVLDLTEEWGAVSDTDLITGVTVVRTAFLEEHPEEVAQFLTDHLTSTAAANEDVATTAQRMVDLGILESAAVAETAIPYCNVTCVTGQDMKDMVSAYLQVLYDLEPSSVGGTLPGDAFYYLG